MTWLHDEQPGFIFLEAIVALLITSMIVTFLGVFIHSTVQLHKFSSEQTTAHYEALHVLQRLEQDVRTAQSIQPEGERLTIVHAGLGTIRYTFSDGVVYRIQGASNPLTENLGGISFSLEQGLLCTKVDTGYETLQLLLGSRQ